MEMCAKIVEHMEKQWVEIEKLKKVVTYQNAQIKGLKKIVGKLLHEQATQQFVL